MPKKNEDQTTGAMEITHSRQVLQVRLTDDELMEQAQKMAEAMEAAERAEGDRKATATHYKAIEEEAQGSARAARTLLRNGYDYRDVDVTITKNWETKTVTITRDDTGETVSHREMRDSELQIPIPAA